MPYLLEYPRSQMTEPEQLSDHLHSHIHHFPEYMIEYMIEYHDRVQYIESSVGQQNVTALSLGSYGVVARITDSPVTANHSAVAMFR